MHISSTERHWRCSNLSKELQLTYLTTRLVTKDWCKFDKSSFFLTGTQENSMLLVAALIWILHLDLDSGDTLNIAREVHIFISKFFIFFLCFITNTIFAQVETCHYWILPLFIMYYFHSIPCKQFQILILSCRLQ